MNWGEIGQWVLTVGVAGLISAAVAYPKNKGEGKKGEGEGSKSHAEGEVALSAEWRAERDNILRQASTARQGAEAAESACREEIKNMRRDFEAFVDVMEELVPLLPPGESQRKARVSIRAARLAI